MNKRKAAISPRRNPQKKLDSVSIVAKCPPPGQCQSYEKLPDAVLNGRLTESLEICERYGFDGEVGFDAIRMMQVLLEVAAR